MTKIMAEINEIETKKKKNTKNQQNKKLDLWENEQNWQIPGKSN
jgi:hypothetical protein